MRFTIGFAVSFAGLLLAGSALAQNNPGTRAGGIYSATPGNTGMAGPGYADVPRPTGGGLGYGIGSALTGTGVTPETPNVPNADTAPNTSLSYGSGLGAAAATGGMPQPPVTAPPRLPKLKNPDALDAYNAPEPATQQTRARTPLIGEDATVDQYIRQAQSDLQARRKLEAMVALEYAETRLLNRSTAYGTPATPDQAPRVRQISAARSAIGNNDVATAQQILNQLLANPSGPPPASSRAARPGGM
jgi:hypothetical protein